MSVLKPRNRLVYFRVSEDEFQQFNHFCESTGARSLSDLARSAMHTLMQVSSTQQIDCISARLNLLENLIRELNREVVQLTRVLGREAVSNDATNGTSEGYAKNESRI
jgi:hypothetical protein